MADTKISALTASTTPLAGTEVLPIVQSGTTKQVSVANLTASRAVSMLSATAGNVQVSGNTIASTDTNGAVTVAPNGIGAINLTTSDKVLISNSTTAVDVYVSAAGTQTNIVAAADRGPGIDLWNSQATDGTFSTIEFQKANGTSVAKIAAQTVSQAGRTGYLSLMTANGAAPAERVSIDAVGDTTIKTGNLVIGTSGKGIDFSATSSGSGTMTSELLADYEEGTWTPVVRGSTTAGTYEIGTNGSTYTKVGRTVTIQGFIQFAAVVTGGGAGDLQITGIPFSKTANSYPAGSVYLALGVYVGIAPIVVFNSFSGSTTLLLQQNATGGYGTSVGIGFASANAYLTFTLSYEV